MIGIIAKRKAAYLLGIAVFLVVADRFLKMLALSGYESVIIPNWLSFRLSLNNHLALSLGPAGGGFTLSLVIITNLVLLLFLIYSLFKKNLSLASVLTFVLIPAISNLLDRLSFGYVIDYFDIPYTVFNLADLSIIIGVVLLFTIHFKKDLSYT